MPTVASSILIIFLNLYGIRMPSSRDENHEVMGIATVAAVASQLQGLRSRRSIRCGLERLSSS